MIYIAAQVFVASLLYLARTHLPYSQFNTRLLHVSHWSKYPQKTANKKIALQKSKSIYLYIHFLFCIN